MSILLIGYLCFTSVTFIIGYLSDIYVIKKSRSKDLGINFLNHFLPNRKEKSDCYEVPQYVLDVTEITFDNTEDLMTYLEENTSEPYHIYWSAIDGNVNRHGMLFYTIDECIIFGISRDSDGVDQTSETECLKLMQEFLDTDAGYITYECTPESTYEEFMQLVKKT